MIYRNPSQKIDTKIAIRKKKKKQVTTTPSYIVKSYPMGKRRCKQVMQRKSGRSIQ